MEIIIIGTEPPCPRCQETLQRLKEAAKEKSANVSIRKIVYSSAEAQQFGKVGTARDIADWAGLSVDWDAVKKIAAGNWRPELDEMLMPLQKKAEQEHWIMTPVVAIDGTVVFFGSVPPVDLLRKLLKEHSMP